MDKLQIARQLPIKIVGLLSLFIIPAISSGETIYLKCDGYEGIQPEDVYTTKDDYDPVSERLETRYFPSAWKVAPEIIYVSIDLTLKKLLLWEQQQDFEIAKLDANVIFSIDQTEHRSPQYTTKEGEQTKSKFSFRRYVAIDRKKGFLTYFIGYQDSEFDAMSSKLLRAHCMKISSLPKLERKF